MRFGWDVPRYDVTDPWFALMHYPIEFNFAFQCNKNDVPRSVSHFRNFTRNACGLWEILVLLQYLERWKNEE